MKKHASTYWTSLISLATAVIGIGIPALAQDAPTASNTTATVITPQGTPAAKTPHLAFGVAEVVKMYQGGISKDVLVGYIESNVLPFHLDADGIIYLQHLGVPQEVTTALIRRDGELQKQAVAYQQQQSQNFQQPPPGEAAPNYQTPVANTAPPVVMPNTASPAVYPYADVAPAPVYPDYSVYPYYGYPYYYGPNVIIGGGWGWGWGRGGWGWGPGRAGFGHAEFGGHGGFGGHAGGHR